jgi:RNA polymerase sigma factor (sigma-70 family)
VRTEDGYVIQQCLDGDAAAFGFLAEKYRKAVYALAYSKLSDFHDAQDITQEVFINAYRKLRTLRRWDNFMGWLYRITSNQCKMLIRARARRPDREFVEDQSPGVIDRPSVDSYRENMVYESIREALDSLPEMYRQVLTLRYFGGMTVKEISRFLGVSPGTIDRQLRGALTQLKEEIPIMMSTAYEQHELPGSFTFRIVEAVKRMRIHPTPRTASLPWGLSLATGIIITFLSLTPQPGVLNRVATATGSPMPVEMKVPKTGEIPVDVLEVSEIPILASKPGSELPDPQASMLAAVNSEDDISTNEAAPDKQVITDPETGVEYTKIRTFTGKSDVINTDAIQHYRPLSLSPNGKFLLWNKTVIPLDDGEPFDLTDMPASRGVWSPDGNMACFESDGAIWMVPVSPDTGQPTGPAGKLIEGEYELNPCSWSPDMEKLAVQNSHGIWTISLKDGAATQITDHPRYELVPVWSPDSKTIAYSLGCSSIWLISAEGGTARELMEDGRRICTVSWSPDGRWLLCDRHIVFESRLLLLRLEDGQELEMKPPQEVGKFFSWSPDCRKMLFYRAPYDWKPALKVAPASGGSSFELGGQLSLDCGTQWSPDSRMLAIHGWSGDRDWVLWIIPLSGDDPFPMKLDISVPGWPNPLSLSPDGTKLLLSVKRDQKTEDIWVAPVSMNDGRTTGPAVRVFSREAQPDREYWAWSPDGTKIAVIHDWDIWMASADGSEPLQLTKTREAELSPVWSPDGGMIAYSAYHEAGKALLHVISVSGGEPRKMLDAIRDYRGQYAWSPDAKELAVVTEDEGLIAIPIAGGKARQITDLSGLATDRHLDLRWSPDGQKLTFRSYGGDDPGSHIYTVPAEGGELTELATDDSGDKLLLSWSPDGKWISYNSDGVVKTRPEGTIWEADLSEFLSSQEREQ